MGISRRRVLQSAATLAGAAGVTALSAGGANAAVPPGVGALLDPIPRTGAHIVLLGTAAGPVPMDGRKGIGSALVVDGRVYLIDMGHGTFDQFQASGLALGDVDRIFVTHLHSDHLSDLFTFLWLRFGGINSMTHAVQLHGPGPAGALPEPSSGEPTPVVSPDNPTPGLADFIDHSLAAAAYDINLRMRDENWPDIRNLIHVNEIPLPDVGAGPLGGLAPPMEPFEVMADENVRVTAILVEHPPVFPSYAFRFDTKYGSVVFSGDTTITPNMVTLSRGADVLVHEAIDLRMVQLGNLTPEQTQHHANSHADVARLGAEVAAPAGVRTLVLTHLAPGTKAVPDELWHAQASIGFGGTVVVGNDLQRISL